MTNTLSRLVLLLSAVGSITAFAQTTILSENFATSQGATPTTSGAIGTSSWSVSRSGADWGGAINGGVLSLTNDASGTTNASGWVYASTALSSVGNFNTKLADSLGLVSWSFNLRQIRTDPAGFGSGSYGVGFVLGSTGTYSATSGNGYAVVLGQSGATDSVRLVSFTAGLQGTLTDLIISTSPLADVGAEYLSVKVTYNPANNTWSLLGRNDGASSFADPSVGSLSSLGTAVNSTYTGIAVASLGAYWQGSTAANQTAFFDNIVLTAIPESSSTALLCGSIALFSTVGLRRRRRV
jgi:hypothetical protein